MKKILIVLIFIGIVTLVSSCKKEQRMDNVHYNIPNNKNMSVFDDLLDKKAEVEWFVSDIRKGQFTSTVSQIFYLPKGIPVMVVNGKFDNSNNTVDYSNTIQPNFSILFYSKPGVYEVSAVKPFFPGENQTWNALSNATIGVYEDTFKIVITSNNMGAATEDGVCMSVKITIWKVFM